MTVKTRFSAFVFSFVVGALFFLSACAQLGQKIRPGFPIQQGLTSESSVEFSVVMAKGKSGKFVVITPQGETLQPSNFETHTRPQSDWQVHKLRFTNLGDPILAHQLVVEDANGQLDQRQFRLFQNTGESLRFAAGACADAAFKKLQAPMWATMAKARPEWVFLIGDNTYAVTATRSEATPEDLWEQYVQGRLIADIYYWKELVPIYAVWDDNDYGQANGHRGYPHREVSAETFRIFNAQSWANDFHQPGPGIAGRLHLRGMHFSFMDNRSFRDEDTTGEHWGQAQEDWLLDDLKSAQLPTWIINGDQIFGGYHRFESFEGRHPKSFERFVTKLKGHTTPVVFLTGDRHLAELMQFPRDVLGQLSFEFTTGPLYAKTYPGSSSSDANPWRVVVKDGVPNFMLFETRLAASQWDITVEALGPDGSLFKRDLSLTTEALKDFTIERQQRRRKYRRARWRKR
jgi:alkaline phosphatase D